MIHELIRASESTVIDGFMATCADLILAHINPGQLKTKDLIFLIHENQSMFTARIPHTEDELHWVEILETDVEKQTSLLARITYYFAIKQGEL